MAVLFVGDIENVRRVTSSLPGPLFCIKVAKSLSLEAVRGVSAVVIVDAPGNLLPMFGVSSNDGKETIARLCTKLNMCL